MTSTVKEITQKQWQARQRHGYAHITNGQKYILTRDADSGATTLVPVKIKHCYCWTGGGIVICDFCSGQRVAPK